MVFTINEVKRNADNAIMEILVIMVIFMPDISLNNNESENLFTMKFNSATWKIELIIGYQSVLFLFRLKLLKKKKIVYLHADSVFCVRLCISD